MANMGYSQVKAPGIVKALKEMGVMYDALMPTRFDGYKRMTVIDMKRCNKKLAMERYERCLKSAKRMGVELSEAQFHLYPVTIKDEDCICWVCRYTPFTALAGYISDALKGIILDYHEDLEMSDWQADYKILNGASYEPQKKGA